MCITSTIFRYTLLIKYSVIYLTCVIPTLLSRRMRAEQSILTLIMNVLITAADIVFECPYYCQWESRGLLIQKFYWNVLITSDWFCESSRYPLSLSFKALHILWKIVIEAEVNINIHWGGTQLTGWHLNGSRADGNNVFLQQGKDNCKQNICQLFI